MELSFEEKIFFNEGITFSFNQPITSRIDITDNPEAKYLVEAFATRHGEGSKCYSLHFRIFEQNENEVFTMLYNGKPVNEIILGFITKEDSHYIEYTNRNYHALTCILLEGNSNYDDFFTSSSLDGLALMVAAKRFLVDAMRLLPSSCKPKFKKVVNAD